ncbi:MAG: 3-oxoacyl-[acyl-carrier-protein] synthase [Actinomycetota bacterium]|jgi:3-oxoacyl-[acyl-carrier-protein] synthase-3|nr:3-oxoacyl-[acyl-carrier-protein] synthase [Actinomycetota bacterium]
MSAALTAPQGAAHARILGVGGYRPSRVVTNAEICERIDSSDEWIRERSGIESRRWAAPDETVIDMSLAAAGKAIAQAGLQPEQVSAIIVATVTHPLQTPSAAAAVAHRLGATDAAAFDVSAACAGFCYGVAMANDMVRGGSAEHVVVIGCEKLSDFTDSYDRTTAFIFGDGAGAVVIGPSDEPGISATVWGSDGSQYDAITQRASWIDVRDHNVEFPTLTMQGQKVFRWAVWQMAPVAKRALEVAGITADDLDAFIPHQANMRIVDAMVKTLKLPEHVPVARDIRETGNTSAASIPLAMERMLEAGEVKSGGLALLIGFGAGLVYAAQVVRLP